jgi:hypothetical protein
MQGVAAEDSNAILEFTKDILEMVLVDTCKHWVQNNQVEAELETWRILIMGEFKAYKDTSWRLMVCSFWTFLHGFKLIRAVLLDLQNKRKTNGSWKGPCLQLEEHTRI